jgi:hypothetical protein
MVAIGRWDEFRGKYQFKMFLKINLGPKVWAVKKIVTKNYKQHQSFLTLEYMQARTTHIGFCII